MNKVVGIGGWLVALLVLAWGGYQFRVNQDLNVRLVERTIENAELAVVVEDLSEGLDDTMTRVAELEAFTRDNKMTGEFSFFRELDRLFGRTVADVGEIFLVESATQWIEGAKSLASLANGDISGVAGLAADFQYEGFIESLDVDEVRAEEIRAAIRSGLEAQIDRGIDSVQADGTTDPNDEAPTLREHLAGVLTEEEMQSFDEYQGSRVDSGVRNGIKIQLGVFASDLDEASRELVLDVLTEETIAAMNDDEVSIEDAYDRTLERVREELDDEQYEIMEDFVERQLSLLDTSTRIFGDWLERFEDN